MCCLLFWQMPRTLAGKFQVRLRQRAERKLCGQLGESIFAMAESCHKFPGQQIGLAMSETDRLSAPVREAMTIVRSLARLYDNGNACRVALRAYEKAATERDEVELEKWRSVLSGLLELAQPKGNLRA